MDMTYFAVWKFKTVEGKLKNCRGVDFTVTKFIPKDPLSADYYQLKYDMTKEMVSIERVNSLLDTVLDSETVPFADVVKLLKKYKLYEVAPLTERHTSSYSADEK